MEPGKPPTPHLIDDQAGLTTVEYIIVLVVVAVAGIGAWQTFGDRVVEQINASTTALPSVGGP